MKTLSFKNGALIAIACGSLFAAACKKDEKKEAEPQPTPTTTETKPADDKTAPAPAPQPGAEKTAKVHCQGINECKGRGACKSTANACSGQNGCKGKGFVDLASEEECKTKGGTVMAAAPM